MFMGASACRKNEARVHGLTSTRTDGDIMGIDRCRVSAYISKLRGTGPAVIAALAIALLGPVTFAAQKPPEQHWVGSWASSQQTPETSNSLPPEDLRDATLRQIVHLSIGGTELRVHISNAFGTSPLRVGAVHIARALSASPGSMPGSIEAGSDTALSFAGNPDVIIPAGADYISDPVACPIAPLSDLAITMYLAAPPEGETSHPGSRATSYLLHGDAVAALELPGAKRFDHWFFISGVDVEAGPKAAAIVTLGDSITDGHGATTNGNDRWPDVLAHRLQADPATRSIAVLNQGIGGNRLLLDGLGPNALARFDRDVLAPAEVRYAIVLEGVNDLGTATYAGEISQAEHDALVGRMIAAYGQMIERAHTHGIRIGGATLTPFNGSGYYQPFQRNEADRQRINAWIRAPGDFDFVVDLDKVVRDPAQPDRLLPAYDSGDRLHPSPAGYKAMGDAIPLSIFKK
jgi:lysophospholipase L1-like esterase